MKYVIFGDSGTVHKSVASALGTIYDKSQNKFKKPDVIFLVNFGFNLTSVVEFVQKHQVSWPEVFFMIYVTGSDEIVKSAEELIKGEIDDSFRDAIFTFGSSNSLYESICHKCQHLEEKLREP